VATRRKLNELVALWNVVEFAVLVLDRRHRLRFANRAAEDMLRRLSHGGANGSGAPGITVLLRNPAFAQALAPVLASGGVRHAGTLGLSAMPLLRATVFGLQTGTAAVLLTDPTRQENLPIDAFRQRFALTLAEARIVQRLAAGETLREAAERCGIAYETARAQLKSAMAKNDWRRQAQMLADIYGELVPFGSTGADG
jgi:DNA-binding CsgD family transcriptional regulator